MLTQWAEPSPGLILCQPDTRKGCSACCGLFNFQDITRESLARFLRGGKSRARVIRGADEDGCGAGAEVRDVGAHICPFQGFCSDGKPGCLLHPNICGVDQRDRSLFKTKICSSFYCPAHTILSDREKRLLIELIDDWYLYTVAIIDPESFLWILKLSESHREDLTSKASKDLVMRGMEIHAQHLSAQSVPIFHYSVSEYNLASEAFSLSRESASNRTVREKIEREAERTIS